MSIGYRLKTIRKALDLNQTDFGARINLSQTTIGQYEKETRPITERVISQLVAEYNINEEYLRHGTGEMLVSHRADLVSELAQKLQLSEREQQLLLAYSTFPAAQRAMVLDFARDLFKKMQESQEKEAGRSKQ
ncbi:putative Xre family transcriptional regulator [Selenomonas ruminantium subsp. lactilytica TAM6421]|uniref:Putative Xre family transcriptional regulator n=1 Tax=Selenomonas ruminantium subsp. lactilytica (strain NBRC 103574 / TAM6421) TaxID=927704 RepID=I0GTX0_SELRL|nr:helix-turn-helix transcriptional regulator [Selenomonas ruminantium]BAL84207.1 putative Xre family transcriptional regulator [Selenomonas ruminantium subsp. lactilytica TAM6421]